jgi:hypothetical protein
VKISHLSSTEQEIHVSVKVNGFNSVWLLLTIYASPRRSECRKLWNNLSIVASLHNLPWVMLGDFNDITSSTEKWGGNRLSASHIAEYCDCKNSCNMIDLGFFGPKFTWTNGHPINSLIMERLDRAWANLEWRTLFPEASVSHLTRTHSDHCPILLSLYHVIPCSLPCPFRFENIWFSNPDFPKIVEQAWADPNSILPYYIKLFTSLVKSWNKHGFGNIFQKKSRILARIAGTQHALALHPSSSLISLDKTLKMEFQTILRLEEEFWALKSRVGWVVEGDRNTSFFHTSTIVRRKFNKISRIRNSLGEWVEDRTQVMNLIQKGFLDLFSTSHVSSLCGFNPPSHAPSISSSEAICLVTPPSPDEIKASLWSLKPFKAPGPDGLHSGFFQRC